MRRPSVVGARATLDALLGSDRGPTWPDARLVSVELDVTTRAARRWLPRRLAPTGRARLFVAEYPETSFGIPYRESGLLLGATFWGRSVLHCPWMVVDDDSAMILGRELFGFPKKMAEISLEVSGDFLAANVVRRGEELLALQGELGAPSDGGPAFGAPMVNVVGLPSPGPARLVWMDPPQQVRAERALEARLRMPGGRDDPLDEVGPAGECPVTGRWLRCDIGVPPARAGGRLGPREAVSLAVAGALPVGLVSPSWFVQRYLFRTR